MKGKALTPGPPRAAAAAAAASSVPDPLRHPAGRRRRRQGTVAGHSGPRGRRRREFCSVGSRARGLDPMLVMVILVRTRKVAGLVVRVVGTTLHRGTTLRRVTVLPYNLPREHCGLTVVLNFFGWFPNLSGSTFPLFFTLPSSTSVQSMYFAKGQRYQVPGTKAHLY